MFYSQFILAKKGPLGTIWIAAHLERKLRKNQVADTDIGVSVDSILFPDVPIALRLSSHLLLGVVRIYSRKVGYLFDDCSEALLKVKQAFRSTAVDLPPEESKAPYHSITLPETFELDDFELPDSDIFQGNYVDHHVSSREQITLQDSMEGAVYSTSKFGLDERFGDGDTSGLDLDEELFLDKVAAAGDASVSADPQTSVEPMTPVKQEEHHEGMAAHSESMFDGGDGVDGDADFMDHAPCTPGLAEEPNLSNIQETSACEDQLGLEDRHLTEYSVKGNLENLSCEDNMNNRSKLLENQAVTGESDADTVHSLAPEENGYHLGNRCDPQLEPDGQLPPNGAAIDPMLSSHPALPSVLSSAAAKSSAQECEVVAASDGQTNERNLLCRLSGMDKVDVPSPSGFHAELQHPNGISSTEVDHDISALSSVSLPVGEDISPSNQRLPEAVSNNVATPGNLEAGETQDISCLEMPKADDCLKQSVHEEDTTGAQIHVLNRCNAAQVDASESRCEHHVDHDPPSNFSGFHQQEASREEASHASGDTEQISKTNLLKEPVSCEDIQKDSEKSNDQVDNVVLEDHQMENMNRSAASALPAPEKILSVPGELVGLPRSIFPDTTPALMGIDEPDIVSKFTSGKKRSYTESTLTEQSLNSAESPRMVRSKKTSGFIPDDDDLLSSILVGRRSSALKLKPTPPPYEITSNKRPRSTTRMSASKRKVLMDDIMVLHGDMIRQQLISVEDIRRTRKKAPCTRAEISMIQKQLLEDEIFREGVLTGVSVELASLYKKPFDLSAVKVSFSDVSPHSAITADPQLTSKYAENHMSNLEEQRDLMFNEPHVEKDRGMEGSNERHAARDDSILEAAVAAVPTENREVDNHDQRLNSDASPLQPDTVADVAVANGFHLEPSDNAAETGPQGTCLSGAEAAVATDIPSAAEVLLSCPNNGGLGDDGDVIAGLPLTDSFNESRREDTSILAEVSCESPNRALAAQVDKRLENSNNENLVDGSGWPENNHYFTSEAEAGTETRVGDAVLLEVAQDSATAEALTNLENIVAENDNQSFVDKGLGTEQPNTDAIHEEMNTEQPNTDATYEEMNLHMLDHSIEVGEYPCQQEDFSYNMMGSDLGDANLGADLGDANLGDLNDLDYSATGNDTGFLNFDDDDEEDEEAEGYLPDADVTHITEFSGWSSRTRAVSKYLQTLFIKESERGRKSLSMDSLLVGKTKKEASRMFFEALVLKTRDYIHVEQVIPFDDITIKPGTKLMKSDF